MTLNGQNRSDGPNGHSNTTKTSRLDGKVALVTGLAVVLEPQ